MKIIEITTSPIDITCAIRSGPSIKLSVRKPSTKKRPTEYQIKYVKNNSPRRKFTFLNASSKITPAKFHNDSYKTSDDSTHPQYTFD